LLVVAFLWPAAVAQAAPQFDEDLQILRMYYPEDEIVVSATRHPTPVSQVAENIVVITAEEIEAMNVHTVAEVLNRVPGLFVSFSQDFGAPSFLMIQGSDEWHVLVLLDEVPLNLNASGAAETRSIPVGIIKRIEIIKGPASSAWGSALGGVINIITKRAGETKRPSVYARASLGEKRTQDHRCQVSGRVGPLGYYLYAGRQASDGLRPSSKLDSYSLFSKLEVALSEGMDVGLQLGHTWNDVGLGDFPGTDITSDFLTRTFLARTFLRVSLSRRLSLHASLYMLKMKNDQKTDSMGLGILSTEKEFVQESLEGEEGQGGSGRIVLETLHHTAVLGAEYRHGSLDGKIHTGQVLQALGVQESLIINADVDRWAVYANDTIVIKNWSITPGIRYDNDSITGSFLSPSLGVTYRLGEHSILRAAVARGFTEPPLGLTSGGGLNFEPNPGLEVEEVWSYQAGVESTAARYVWMKVTVFRHDLENAIVVLPFAAGPPTYKSLIVNRGKIRRLGLEAEAETIPVYNLSLWAGFAYVHKKASAEPDATVWYTYNAGLRYDDKKGLQARLFGHYIWWNEKAELEGSYDNFVWDFNIQKRFSITENLSTVIFASIHNLFDGLQYQVGDNRNPGRWVEAGFKVNFH